MGEEVKYRITRTRPQVLGASRLDREPYMVPLFARNIWIGLTPLLHIKYLTYQYIYKDLYIELALKLIEF